MNYKEKTDIELQKESNIRAIRKLVLYRKNLRKIRFELDNEDEAKRELNHLLTKHEEQWENGIDSGVVFSIDYDRLQVHQIELPE